MLMILIMMNLGYFSFRKRFYKKKIYIYIYDNMIKHHLIQFIIMIIVGILFNPMNLLAYRIKDIYLSLTLVYGGIAMASNMLWSHEIISYLVHNRFNFYVFIFGVILTVLITILLLRKQFLVNDEQYLKRMISHHSTALTTSHFIYKKTKNPEVKKLAYNIIKTQEKEIKIMKSLIR
jgi:hypothetical protein